jgi:hypothetical protein
MLNESLTPQRAAEAPVSPMSNVPLPSQRIEVVVTRIDLPAQEWASLILKIALAVIPAMIIAGLILVLLLAIMTGFLAGLKIS